MGTKHLSKVLLCDKDPGNITGVITTSDDFHSFSERVGPKTEAVPRQNVFQRDFFFVREQKITFACWWGRTSGEGKNDAGRKCNQVLKWSG